jgi:hypothetical protein
LVLRRGLALALILILAVSSLIIVESAFAQSIPKPSVPEFSLQFVGSPYNALVVTVKNQPYDSDYTEMYYNIRLKNHNEGTIVGSILLISYFMHFTLIQHNRQILITPTYRLLFNQIFCCLIFKTMFRLKQC